MANLLAEISGLSVAEKLSCWMRYGRTLWGHEPVAVGEEQSAELDRRVGQYEQNPSAVVSWAVMQADLLKQ